MTRQRSIGRWTGAVFLSVAALTGALLVPQVAHAATPVSGQVTYNGVGIAGVDPEFYRYDPEDGGWDDTGQYADAETNASGNWSFTGSLSQDGTYALYYYTDDSPAIYASNQGKGGVRDYNKLTADFTVTGGVASVTSVGSVALATNSGALQVTLRNGLTGAVITPPGSTNGYVSAYSGLDVNGDYVPGNSAYEDTTFDGILLIHGLGAGTYYSVYGSADNYSVRSTAVKLAVAVGQTAAVDIALYPTGTPSTSTLLPNPKIATITGVPKVGTLLTAGVPTSSATATYQWYTDDGNLIPDATSQTFVPTTRQLGHTIYVESTLSAPGYSPATIESDSTKVVQIGDPNVATLTVAGTAKFGKTLKATITGGDATATSSFQWYRNGAPIVGADGSSYTVTKADVGQKLFASVTSVLQGHTNAVIPSNIVGVAHDKATVAFSAKTSISKSTKLKVKINLKDGATKNAATGTIKVYYTSKKFKTATFTTKSTTKTVTLPKLSKGKHTIKIKYPGDTHYLAKSTSFKVTVK